MNALNSKTILNYTQGSEDMISSLFKSITSNETYLRLSEIVELYKMLIFLKLILYIKGSY